MVVVLTNPRVIAYARLSQEREESTSIRRQWESIEGHASLHGWTIAERFEDVDVSGYKAGTRRPGRDAFVAAMPHAHVALFYRVDRVARSLLDFASIMRTAEQHDVALVSATESIDTSSPMGRAMLQIVAIFAELESRTISARVTSSVDYLRRNGRRAGGQVPFGWRNVPSPTGAGFVLALDPERAPLVRDAAERVMDGESLASIARSWTEAGVPVPQSAGRVRESWGPDTIGLLLRRPVVAGLTVHRGDLVRGADGMPVVSPEAALMPVDAWRDLVTELDRRAVPRDRRTRGLPLLHGIAVCASCGSRLYAHRPADPRRAHRYTCQNRECHAPVVVAARHLEDHVSGAFLAVAGPLPATRREVSAGPTNAADRAVVEEAIAATLERMTADDADMEDLAAVLADLKARRAALRGDDPGPTVRLVPTGRTFAETWHDDADTDARRGLLASALDVVIVRKGVRGRHGLDPGRVDVIWREGAHDPD